MSVLDINSGSLTLDITSTPAKLNIRSFRPKMKLNHKPVHMQVDRRIPTFHVNWGQVRAESHMPPAMVQIRQFRSDGTANTMQFAANTSRRGDMMMHIESGDALTAIAQEAISSPAPEINISSMPQNAPEIDWDEGVFRINWEQHELSIEWENIQRPEIYVEPHSVEVHLKNLPGVKIKVNGNIVKEHTGNKLDKKI